MGRIKKKKGEKIVRVDIFVKEKFARKAKEEAQFIQDKYR